MIRRNDNFDVTSPLRLSCSPSAMAIAQSHDRAILDLWKTLLLKRSVHLNKPLDCHSASRPGETHHSQRGAICWRALMPKGRPSCHHPAPTRSHPKRKTYRVPQTARGISRRQRQSQEVKLFRIQNSVAASGTGVDDQEVLRHASSLRKISICRRMI